jgi:hypothetical protein
MPAGRFQFIEIFARIGSFEYPLELLALEQAE